MNTNYRVIRFQNGETFLYDKIEDCWFKDGKAVSEMYVIIKMKHENYEEI